MRGSGLNNGHTFGIENTLVQLLNMTGLVMSEVILQNTPGFIYKTSISVKSHAVLKICFN